MCWADLQVYATLVRPETILAWHRKLVALKYTAKRKLRTQGQKRMEVIRELCVKFAEENPGWGYRRIQGALANVGYKISGTTVGNILRDKGIFPSPERGKQSNWKRFIRSHMDVTAVADFFTVEVWTLRGLVRYHVFFVMKLAQRQVEIVHIGCQVDCQVMAQLARNLTDGFDGYLCFGPPGLSGIVKMSKLKATPAGVVLRVGTATPGLRASPSDPGKGEHPVTGGSPDLTGPPPAFESLVQETVLTPQYTGGEIRLQIPALFPWGLLEISAH